VDGVDGQGLVGDAEGDLLVEYQGTLSTVRWVFGATLVVFNAVLPTLRKAIVVVPVEPPQVVVDVDLTAWSVIVGAGASITVASATEALAVYFPGEGDRGHIGAQHMRGHEAGDLRHARRRRSR
jgi:hypothetical protein